MQLHPVFTSIVKARKARSCSHTQPNRSIHNLITQHGEPRLFPPPRATPRPSRCRRSTHYSTPQCNYPTSGHLLHPRPLLSPTSWSTSSHWHPSGYAIGRQWARLYNYYPLFFRRWPHRDRRTSRSRYGVPKEYARATPQSEPARDTCRLVRDKRRTQYFLSPHSKFLRRPRRWHMASPGRAYDG